MKKALACASVLALLAAPAFAIDIAKDPNVVVDGVSQGYTNDLRNGNAIVISVTVDTFSDNAPLYQTALTDAGLVVDLVYDPQLNGWPDLSGYKLVVVVYNDCWWDASLGAFSAADEAILAAYSGALVIVGQDYLFSVGIGFAGPRFGFSSVIEDINFGTLATMDIDGLPGGPFDGLAGAGAVCCWETNCWFTDDILDAGTPTQDWADGDGFSGQGGSAVADGIFSVNAYECFELGPWADAMVSWLKGGTPTEEASWTDVKAAYR